MKLIFSIIVIIFWLIYASGIQIQLKPLSIHFKTPYFTIGWILIVLGIICIQIQTERITKKEIISNIRKIINEEIKK